MIKLARSETSFIGETADPFAAFVTDETTRALVAKVAKAQGWRGAEIEAGGLAAAARVIAVTKPARILLVDISDSEDPVADFPALKEAVLQGSKIIVIGEANDARLARALLKAGAAEYIVKPFSGEALGDVLSELRRAPDQDGVAATCRTVAVIGARGGVGASTVANACAVVFGRDMRGATLLLDLDLIHGDVALSLNLSSGPGLREALEVPERVDELFLERVIQPAVDYVDLLAAHEDPGSAIEIHPGALNELLSHLGGRYDNLVIDLPRHFPGIEMVLSRCDQVVVVTVPTMAGLRDAIRMRAWLAEVTPEASVRMVLNRTDRKGGGHLARKEFEARLDAPIDVVIGEDPAAMAAANEGRPAAEIAPKGPLVLGARRLVASLSGAARSSGGLISKLFNRRR